jgi:superoxide reductase
MKNRRDFLKSSAVVSTGLIAATAIPAIAKENSVKNIFAYSAAEPGRWEGKAGSHAPVVTVDGNSVTVETKHGMAEMHYIVKHTIVTASGEVLGEQVFFPKQDKKAISTYEIKKKHEKLYALSFCNLHDLWVSEFRV